MTIRTVMTILVTIGLSACAQRPVRTTADTPSGAPPAPHPVPHPVPQKPIIFSPPHPTPIPDLADVSDRAWGVYRKAYVIDTHNDLPTKMLDDGYDADVRHPSGFGPSEGHTDFPRLVESGITGQFLSAWVDAPFARRNPDESYSRAVRYTDAIHAFVERHPNHLLFGTGAGDVERAKRDGKVAIFIGVEGGHAIEGSLVHLRDLHRRGARYMTLTWNNGNAWAGSSIGEGGTRTGGLTAFGREVVREMNRLGMIVDISHVSDSTFWDVLAASEKPVIASHSSARALNDHPRNLSDAQLRAVAKNGGVVNVNFYSRFVDPKFRADAERVERELQGAGDTSMRAFGDSGKKESARRETLRRARFAALPQTPLSVLIDHIDHIAKVAGVDHVGLGSDFDGVSALPLQMDDVTKLPRIAQGLLDRGYSDDDVSKVLGGNMLRVMRVVMP
ncbi:MAG: dipeptidase [Gemmatimonadaceae bacterium]